MHNEPTVLDRAVDAGAVFWTLAKYWIYRLVFHGETPLEPVRQMHHALPKDMIGAASWMTFSSFSGVWLIAGVFAVPAAGSAIAAGFMLGKQGEPKKD